MPVILYRDKNYEGPSVRLQPGFFAGRQDLEGRTRGSSSGEDLDNKSSSIRVDTGYIAVLYSNHAPTPGGLAGGSRVLIGPTEIADLAAVGMDDKVSSVRVLMHEPYRAAVPRDFGVTLHQSISYQARPSGAGIHIGQGEYNRSRLGSAEVGIDPGGIKAVCVGVSTLVILYEGPEFDSMLNAITVLPGECISSDTMAGINSIRVLYTAAGQGLEAGQSPFERAVAGISDPLTDRPREKPARREKPALRERPARHWPPSKMAPSAPAGATGQVAAVKLLGMLMIVLVALLAAMVGCYVGKRGLITGTITGAVAVPTTP